MKDIKTHITTHINSKYHYHEEVNTHLKNIRELNLLQKNGTIIIKKADKANKLIIMDKEEYTNKALTQLNNTIHYRLIEDANNEEITNAVINNYNTIKQLITYSTLNKSQKSELIKYTRPYAKHTRFPRIYFNPKTHKAGNPLRPIISGINWATESSAILLDETLKPLIYKQAHIPKDTFDFIKIIEEQQYDLLAQPHENLFLVTFDVVALYTAIPQDLATTRITRLIQANNSIIPAEIFTEITKFILNNNYFTFQDTTYKQEHGIAMGNPAGGAIANAYMLEWDKISMNHPIYKQHIHTYARYYDDGFIIWNGPEIQLKNYLKWINTIDKHIEITSIHGKTIPYLDIELKLTEQNIIHTRTHRKVTATDTYLDYRSAHPKHLKANLPMSILLRSLIISNTQATFKIEKTDIIQRFKNSHYPSKVIDDAVNKTMEKYKIPHEDNQFAYLQARRTALTNIGKHPENRNTNKAFLPITHWPHLPYKQHLNKHTWASKLPNCKITSIQPNISYKQPDNMLRLLTNSRM